MIHVVRRIVLLAAMVGFAAGASAQDLGSADSSEHLIKAGYVYNFAKLVEWPASAVRTGQPLVIGVLGNDAFATVLARVVEGKKIVDRSFVVKRLKDKEFKDCGCQILFIAEGDRSLTSEIIQFQRAASMLTIAEAPDFAKRGGIIGLTVVDSRIRFLVNVEAAAQAGLNISSRLLALATIVRTSR